jgi:hypothetical protein
MHLPILIYASSDTSTSLFCAQSKAQNFSIVFVSSFAIQMREAEFGHEPPLRLITEFRLDNVTSSFHENFLDALTKFLDRLNEIIGSVLQSNLIEVCYHNFHRSILACISQLHSVRALEETRVINCRLFWSQSLGEESPVLANLNNHGNLVDANNALRSGFIWRFL